MEALKNKLLDHILKRAKRSYFSKKEEKEKKEFEKNNPIDHAAS